MKVSEKQVLNRERQEILQQLEDWLETPMLVLGFVWLALFVVELIWGLTPLLQAIGTVIWIIFILDFILEFTLAPQKLTYLQRNWLTVISLPLPALRLFGFGRVLRVLNTALAVRGIRLLRVITRTNRGMRAISASLGRRGFGYVVTTTLVITLVGAAGMYAFESNIPDGRGLNDYGTALWWTAMLVSTMGSEFWPETAEGRVLALLLSLYGLAIFGYITASFATFFIGQDAEAEDGEVAGSGEVAALRREIAALRDELRSHG